MLIAHINTVGVKNQFKSGNALSISIQRKNASRVQSTIYC